MSKEKILNAIHIKWLSKAKTAVINGEEMTVLPYGYLTQACSEVIDQTREETIKDILSQLRLKLRNTYRAEDIADIAFLTESDLESVLNK